MRTRRYILYIFVVVMISLSVHANTNCVVDLCSVVSCIHLDPSLKAIVEDPSLLDKIDQEQWFAQQNAKEIWCMDAADIAGRLFTTNSNATSKVALCAADSRLYFWNSTRNFNVVGWFGVNGAGQHTKHDMTVWIFSTSGGGKDADFSDYDKMLSSLMSLPEYKESDIRKILTPKQAIYNISSAKYGVLLQLQFTLPDGVRFQSRFNGAWYAEVSSYSQLSFWPPYKKEDVVPSQEEMKFVMEIRKSILENQKKEKVKGSVP